MNKIYLLVILLLVASCATTKAERVNTIDLPGWGSVIFEDTLVHPDGYECWGLYDKINGLHVIRIARDSFNFEQSFTHEWLHSKGWNHRTEAEWMYFNKKLAEKLAGK